MKFHTTASGAKLVTLIPGDGIGPEVVASAQRLVEASGAKVEWEERRAGASVFIEGLASGVPDETIESIHKTRVVLKGPLETPVGFGEKSANVTLRKLFETYGNIRPARELPGIATPYSGRGIDLVVVRENIEDLYAGIEHMQTPGVAQGLKLISRKGCEKIIRLAFELARAEGRKLVHCATKSNIMKLTEGLMHHTFEEVAPEYPDIEAQHIIIDNCAHQLVKRPEQFDVIVATNMNGDIISDLSSALVGGLGFAPSANLGSDVAIFEAVHGSAPKYAGQNVANPTALVLSAVMMLRHLGEFDPAATIEGALLATLDQGRTTRDIAGDRPDALSTTEFTEAIVANFGESPKDWQPRDYKPLHVPVVSTAPDFVHEPARRVIGVDVFVESALAPEELGASLERLADGTRFHLRGLSNRGTVVYPPSGAMPDLVDQWFCRFTLAANGNGEVRDGEVMELVQRVAAEHRWMHVEKLQEFHGEEAFTKAQGED